MGLVRPPGRLLEVIGKGSSMGCHRLVELVVVGTSGVEPLGTLAVELVDTPRAGLVGTSGVWHRRVAGSRYLVGSLLLSKD